MNTTSQQLVVNANVSQGWLALNLVNSGAVSNLKVSLDSHSMHIYTADGLYMTLQEVKVRYRLSMVIKLPSSNLDRFLKSLSANNIL